MVAAPRHLTLLCTVGLASVEASPPRPPPREVQWSAFLGRSDLTSSWQRPTASSNWTEPGPPISYDLANFLGNGNVGAMVQATREGSVSLVLGRTDSYDRRIPGSPFATGSLLCDVARLPLGTLTLTTKGDILSAASRVRLWDGEVYVQLVTTAGKINARLLAFGGSSAPSAGGSGIIVATTNATGKEQAAQWNFVPGNANANAPHPIYKTESYSCPFKAPRYKSNPNATISSVAGMTTAVQRLLVGPAWATAHGSRANAGRGITVLATTAPLDGEHTAADLAVRDATWALDKWADGSLLREHRAAWHTFYTDSSFLSIAHPKLEQFYWIQQYKLASGMGLRGDLAGDGGAMDHTAPWYLPNNGLFNWDLNIQMTWWPVAGANRLQLMEPLLRFLERHTADFCLNVVPVARDPTDCDSSPTAKTLAGPSAHTGYVSVGRIEVGHGDPGGANKSIEPPGPLGDLVWALTNVEQAWRFSRNRTIAARLYPLLSGAVNYYLHFLSDEAPKPKTARVMNNTNFPGDNLPVSKDPRVNYSTYEPCQAACDANPDCDMWHFFAPGKRTSFGECGLKSCKLDKVPARCPTPIPDTGCVAGVKVPPPAGPSDGRYHLPPTYSPEYMGGLGEGDTAYEIAICRWGLAAALELASELGIKEPRAASWQDRLGKLADFTVDPQYGLNVAKHLPFEQPHRHFSHLMGAVLKDPRLLATTEGTALVSKSLDHWRALRDPCSLPVPRPVQTRSQGPIIDAGWTGFSYAVSALLHARLQRPVEAVADVTFMVENSIIDGKFGLREGHISLPVTAPCPPVSALEGSVFHPNTFYAEGVGDPTGETPFGTVAALQELLTGTTAEEEVITLFPGFGDGSVSTKIPAACFSDLRVSGAFLISGCFANGTTTFATVHSEAGRRCWLQLPSLARPFVVDPPTVAMNVSSDGSTIELALGAGESATFYPKGGQPLADLAVRPIPLAPGQQANFWGHKAAKTDDTAATHPCTSNLDCRLNGNCTSGACVCSPAWTGPQCATLNLLPTAPTGDLKLPNISTWGMGCMRVGSQWHGFFAEMERHCGLTAWETNSLIAHAVADTPNGPWRRVGVTSGVWSHNPATAVTPDGTLLLFHIGSGSGGVARNGSRESSQQCHGGYSPCGTHPSHHCNSSRSGSSVTANHEDARKSVGGTIDFFTAQNPEGPWKAYSAKVDQNVGGNNPAPWVHPNGSVFIVVSSGGMAMLRAAKWQGPYTVVTRGACGKGEDPFLYTDSSGFFHCLYHRSGKGGFSNTSVAGGHAYSVDGFTWHVDETPAYSTIVEYEQGGSKVYGKRERPHLLFSPETGEPTHLTSGVCLNSNYTLCNDNPYPGYFDYTFTSVQPIKTLKSDDTDEGSTSPIQCTAAAEYPQWATFHPSNGVTRDPVSGDLSMDHLNDANAIFEFGGLYHAMAQKGGGNWTHCISNDLSHWYTLPDALDGEPNSTWDQDTCDGTVSFPDLGHSPYNGTAPIMLYGPDCGGALPPLPPAGTDVGASSGSGDYPRIAVALPALGATSPLLVDWTNRSEVSFDGVPCSFPGRVFKSEKGPYFNMLCAWAGRAPWARYTTTDPTLLTGWKLADKAFATDASGATPAGGGAGALFHRIPGSVDNLFMINMDTGTTFGVGTYDPQTEKMTLRSDHAGHAIHEVINYGTGNYKWATTGLSSDGRLLTIAWLDEGECSPDSPRGPQPRDCNGMRHRSVLSLPREIRWDEQAGCLISRPVAELARLRNASFILDQSVTVEADSRRGLAEIPESAGGALDLQLSFVVPAAKAPQNFGVAVRASRDSLEGAAVQLMFNISAPVADGSRTIGVADVARPQHLPPLPTGVSRWMNDSDLGMTDYNLSHHSKSSGDSAATCQALCDADQRCAGWVWVVRTDPGIDPGALPGNADCVLKSLPWRQCPAVTVHPHPCSDRVGNRCRITSGVKHAGECKRRATPNTVSFNVTLLKHEKALDVRILVDRPIVEVFVQGGRGAFVAASNFSLEHASVHLVNDGAMSVEAHVNASGMACGWASELPTPRQLGPTVAQ